MNTEETLKRPFVKKQNILFKKGGCTMIILKILVTKLGEKDLFLKLVERGQRADVPYYYSVDSYDSEEGWVKFTRLGCSPAPSFHVGVAGNSLLVCKAYFEEVKTWLLGWKIELVKTQTRTVTNLSDVHKLLNKLRKKDPYAKDRATIYQQLKKEIADFNNKVNRTIELDSSVI